MSEDRQLVFREESNIDEENTNNTCRRRCPKVLLVFLALYVLLLVLFLAIAMLIRKETARPHVILILVNDLGWSDVQWRDEAMRTPALQALLEEGVLLNNSYVHPLDSPSRAALFTGNYPFHMGLQRETMDPYTPTYLPENFTLLPSHLQELGYKTHMVGKWHLGFCDWRYTPTSRGFGSFAGFYTNNLDYYTHRDDKGYYDFRSGEVIDLHAEGKHSTQVFTDRATYLIKNHDRTVPLFMVLSFQALRAPVQVPEQYFNGTCGHINDTARQKMCALIAMMDESVGNVTSALYDKEMLKSSVIIVTTDNGGVASQGSSNAPLRGGSGELYEGGTRVVTLMSSPALLSTVHGTTYEGLFHQVDWVPTILSIADGPLHAEVDGISQWDAIRTGGPSPRNEIIYNIVGEFNNNAIRVDDFKLIEGAPNYTNRGNAERDYTVQLYDLSSDPGESKNLADTMPEKVATLKERVKTLRESLVTPTVAKPDPKADPALWNGVWSPGWC